MNYPNYLIMSLRAHYSVIASIAKQSRFRLLRYARNDGILEFIKYFINRDLGAQFGVLFYFFVIKIVVCLDVSYGSGF